MTGLKDLVVQTIRENDSFLLASHISPDGDALGSMAGFGWILRHLGKEFVIYSPEPAPQQYSWLNFPAPLTRDIPSLENRWAIILDCGDRDRMGRALVDMLIPDRTVVIDHHQNNPGFGSVNWIDPVRSSVGEMVAEIALELGVPLRGELALSLYLAIVTDTGYFTFGNTGPRTLEIVGTMLKNGLKPGEVNPVIQNQWSMNRLHLQGQVLKDAQLHYKGTVGLVTVPSELLHRTGTSPEDCDGLVNFLNRIRGVRIAAMLRENGAGTIKFSLRSSGDTDVQRIARMFDGGGHKNAAGGTIKGTLDEARKQLLEAIGRAPEIQDRN
ncbi:MAG: DHH family phosphoesterase [Desulfovibrionales bacterium]